MKKVTDEEMEVMGLDAAHEASFRGETEAQEIERHKREDAFFRKLTSTEEEAFRAYAGAMFKKDPNLEIDPLWHPVVRDELKKLKKGGK